MSATFDKVADIIAETCDIPRDNIKPESHAINDLEIDSLDFLDIAFAIDKTFGIKLPLEQWTQEVNDGKASTEQYFVLKNLCGALTSGSGYHFGVMTIAEKQSQTACFLCCLYRALAAIGHCVMLKTHNKPQYVQFGKGWLRPLRGSRGKQFEIVPFPHPLTAQEAGKALQDWKGAVVEENKTSKPSTGQ